VGERDTAEIPAWCGATSFGGNCPVQAEGELDGAFWYFRARGDGWSITVHTDPEQRYYYCDSPPLYAYEEEYGAGPFDAGWMPREEAAAFIVRELSKWRDSKAVAHG